MKCPICGLKREDRRVIICDCGYNYQTQILGKPRLETGASPYGDVIALPDGRNFVFASLHMRLFGQILDAIIAILIAVVTALIFSFLNNVGTIVILILVAYGYLLFSDGFKGGQSFGKMIVKTAVIDSTSGTPCSYGQSFLRNLLQLLGIFDWIFIFGKKRQRLGEKAAGTYVIRSNCSI